MLKTQTVAPVSQELMEEIGFTWHTDPDGSAYVAPELLPVSEEEAEAYYTAANELYDMFIEAGQHVIDNNLFEQLGIPENMIQLIKLSWDDDDWHLYGRFDFAGGVDGKPIKLLEFNADTATSLFETSIIQWALLKSNGMDEAAQFNNAFEMIRDNFRRLITNDDGLEKFDEYYNNERILFSSVRDLPEDEQTTRLLQRIAIEAGYSTDFTYMDEAGFLPDEGVFNKDQESTNFWFKLWPWEDIAADEPELTDLLTEIARKRTAVFINPAYTLLFQSKGILKILHELYPDSPYLLAADDQPLDGVKQVSKPLFGREGGNVSILDADGTAIESVDGPYDIHPMLYQEYAELATDEQGRSYQAGVFFAWEACGLGFRRGTKILNDTATFVPHVIA
ncbi:MAG: glutathionylspermidine synthase family protein [Leucothrix sp.]